MTQITGIPPTYRTANIRAKYVRAVLVDYDKRTGRIDKLGSEERSKKTAEYLDEALRDDDGKVTVIDEASGVWISRGYTDVVSVEGTTYMDGEYVVELTAE